MATNKNAKAMCDTCGFVYAQRVMRLSSYDTLQCPQCFDGRYDLKNHHKIEFRIQEMIQQFKMLDQMMVVEI